MAVCTADFETGTLGNHVSDSDPGSLTAWGVGNFGDTYYDDTHVAHGTLACKIQLAAGHGAVLPWTTPFGTPSDHYGRIYVYFSAAPADDVHMGAFLASDFCRFGVDTAGKVFYEDSSGTSTMDSAINFNQFQRIEWHITHAAGTGQAEFRLYDGDSAVASQTKTFTNRDNGTAADRAYFGCLVDVASPVTFWIDAIVADAATWPGPAEAAKTYTVLNGSDEQLVNINAGGVDVDAATYKDAVQLSDAELAALLSASFGKNNVAVLPDLTGVADARQIKKTTFSAETESA